MRRTDREITDTDEILKIISNSTYLHLGLFDEQYPYVVPLNYGFEYKDNKYIFYLHGAKEGHKLDLIKKNNKACIEIENGIELISGGDNPSKYSTKYSSVIANGYIEIIEEYSEKEICLKKFMKFIIGNDFSFNKNIIENVTVMRFVAESISAKANKGRS